VKVLRYDGPSNSAVGVTAIIEVLPGEAADIEQMLILLDGDTVGHFGLTAKLLTVGHEPDPKSKSWNEGDFGFDNASTIKTKTRYYKAHVSRD
jgi:hypothetical protein